METRLILDTLKQELRKQAVTYRQVAKALGLSEASVKRMFSENTFSITRLATVCGLLDLEIADLIHQMEKNIALTNQLTLEQEKELVGDIKLLLMGHFLMHKLAFSDIIRIYDISETEGIQLLARLDRMKLIELQPGNRVKLLISKDFEWIPGGPIQRFHEQNVQSEFFQSSFDGAGECRIFISGFLSRAANDELVRKIKHLEKLANELILESDLLPLNERFGSSLVLAIRPWEVKLFDQLRRVSNEKEY
jgi:predicted transcriptional regulator